MKMLPRRWAQRRRSPVAIVMSISILFAIVSQGFYFWTHGDDIHPSRLVADQDVMNQPRIQSQRKNTTGLFGINLVRRRNNIGIKLKDPQVVLTEQKLSPVSIAKLPTDAWKSCTSPEQSVEWPLHGTATSILNPQSRPCGIQGNAEFVTYLRNVTIRQHIQPLIHQVEDECQDLVVFGVAFGGNFLQDMNTTIHEVVNSTALLEKHGRCFFMFTLQNDVDRIRQQASSSPTDPFLLGHTWLIPIPQAILPYSSNRRNAKLLKYMGHYAFSNSSTIVWQDAKFFRPKTNFDRSIPKDYSQLWRNNDDGDDDNTTNNRPCVTAMSLPIHVSTFSDIYNHVSIGQTSRFDASAAYQDHCTTIISALRDRPNVTDNPQGLVQQCQAYLRAVQQEADNGSIVSSNNNNINPLNLGLVDSALLVWNEGTEQCRTFNSQLRCSLLDQIHCHSDRDQIMIPFVLSKMMGGWNSDKQSASTPTLQPVYRRNHNGMAIPVDQSWHSRYYDLDFVSSDPLEPTVIFLRTMRSACHWYHTFPLGQDPGTCSHKEWLPKAISDSTEMVETTSIADSKNAALSNQVVFAAGETQFPSTFRNCSNSIAPPCTTSNYPNPFQNHVKDVQRSIIQPLLAECADLVVFGTAFDMQSIKRLVPAQQSFKQSYLKRLALHGKCLFTLVLEEDVEKIKIPIDKSHYTTAPYFGNQWLVPMKQSALSEMHLRHRGVYFKYLSSILFPGIKSVIWQSSYFYEQDSLGYQPEHYRNLIGATTRQSSCVTAFGMPVITPMGESKYIAHCKHLALTNNGTSFATTRQILEQCNDFIQRVYQKELSIEFLSHALVDSDFMIWNESTETCRRFNEQLRCKMQQEMGCGAGGGLDMLAFPFALYELGLQTEYRRNPRKPVDEIYNRRIHDIQFVQLAEFGAEENVSDEKGKAGAAAAAGKNGAASPPTKRYAQSKRQAPPTDDAVKHDMVTVVRTLCHWSTNNKRVGEACPTFQKSNLNNHPERLGMRRQEEARIRRIQQQQQPQLAKL